MLKKISLLAVVVLFAISTTSYTEAQDNFDEKGFSKWIEKVLERVSSDKTYKPLPIKTNAQEEQIIELAAAAYAKEVSKEEFIKILKQSYPKYEKTILKLADVVFSVK